MDIMSLGGFGLLAVEHTLNPGGYVEAYIRSEPVHTINIEGMSGRYLTAIDSMKKSVWRTGFPHSAHVGFVRVLSDDLDDIIKIVGRLMFTSHGVFKTVNIEVRIPKKREGVTT